MSDRTAGHLSDHNTHRCPPGAAPERTGWTRSERPIGPLLGSINADRNLLVLRPTECLAAVAYPAEWTVTPIGDNLAAAWLVDTTLDTVAAARRPTVDPAVIESRRPEPVWQLPLTVFDPGQFFSATLLRPRFPR